MLLLLSSALAGPPITALSAGQSHSCALSDGDVVCWGGLTRAQLRTGGTPPGPVRVATGARTLATGARTESCVARDDGIWCWTVGESPALRSPLVAEGLALGSGHGCAVVSSEVHCWGYNARGQLGDGTTTDREDPVAIGLTGVESVALGLYHSCALLEDGGVSCWGSNSGGQVGTGELADGVLRPVRVDGIDDAVQVVAGNAHTCALLASGEVWCWGSGGFGQLGNGSNQRSPTPVQVVGLGAARRLSAGMEHTCALVGGAAWCWGGNISGQVGREDTDNRLRPVHVKGLEQLTHIAAGHQHTCAARRGGEVLCWGQNFTGQLGDGGRESTHEPREVPWR